MVSRMLRQSPRPLVTQAEPRSAAAIPVGPPDMSREVNTSVSRMRHPSLQRLRHAKSGPANASCNRMRSATDAKRIQKQIRALMVCSRQKQMKGLFPSGARRAPQRLATLCAGRLENSSSEPIWDDKYGRGRRGRWHSRIYALEVIQCVRTRCPLKNSFHTSQRPASFFGFFWASAHGDSEVCGAMRYGTPAVGRRLRPVSGRASRLMDVTTSNLGQARPNHPPAPSPARRDYRRRTIV